MTTRVLVRRESEGAWIVNAVAHVEEIEELFGIEFEPRDFDTVGGLVVSSFGRVPEEGETIDVRGIRLEVLRSDPRRVYEVRVLRSETPEEGPERS
jgi:magnesium and cobalt transporter